VRVWKREKRTDTPTSFILVVGKEVLASEEYSSVAYGRVARELLLEARAGLGSCSAAASSVPSVQFPTLR
jgi:hypothetical protein